jgi:hypothetical protein
VQRVCRHAGLDFAARENVQGGLKHSDTFVRTPYGGTEMKDRLTYAAPPDGLERTVDFALQFFLGLFQFLIEGL